MRWGVRDEATDDHVTTELCLNEIENCQRLSTGPNFCVRQCESIYSNSTFSLGCLGKYEVGHGAVQWHYIDKLSNDTVPNHTFIYLFIYLFKHHNVAQ